MLDHWIYSSLLRILICPCQDLLYAGSLDILLLATDIDMPLPGPLILDMLLLAMGMDMPLLEYCMVDMLLPPMDIGYAPARTS